MSNLFADIKLNLPDEQVQTLLAASGLRIERIISHGHASAASFWYDQPDHEWILVLQGAARIRFEDGSVELRSGDFLNIAAHQRHRVEWTTTEQPTIWLAVHYGEASDER